MPDHRQGRGPPHLGLHGQEVHRRPVRASSSSTPATVASASPRWRRSRPRSSRSSRSGRTRIPTRSSSPTGWPTTRPGDLNRVFFSTGGGEAVETAFKLAKYYWKLQGSPTKHKVISRAVAYHGTPQGALAITGIPAMKEMFEPLTPGGFRVPNTNFYRAEEMGFAGATGGGVRPLGREPHRGDDPVRGPRDRRRGLPRARAELGRLLPAAARLLPAGARDLRQVRRAARVSDEVICAFGRIGHMFACDEYGYVPDMITCAKGMTSGYSPIGATIVSDQLYEPFRARRHVLLPRLHLRRAPGVGRRRAGEPRHLRGGEAQRARARELPALPADAREAERPADRRRRARRRLLLRHRAREGQGDEGDLRRRRVRAPAARLPLEGALRRRPVLPRRRPRRPRHPARAAADDRTSRSSTRSGRSCGAC